MAECLKTYRPIDQRMLEPSKSCRSSGGEEAPLLSTDCMAGKLTQLHNLLGCTPNEEAITAFVDGSEPESVKVYSGPFENPHARWLAESARKTSFTTTTRTKASLCNSSRQQHTTRPSLPEVDRILTRLDSPYAQSISPPLPIRAFP